jgi:hypothetical protein
VGYSTVCADVSRRAARALQYMQHDTVFPYPGIGGGPYEARVELDRAGQVDGGAHQGRHVPAHRPHALAQKRIILNRNSVRIKRIKQRVLMDETSTHQTAAKLNFGPL